MITAVEKMITGKKIVRQTGGVDFLNKSTGEKYLQLLLAHSLMESTGHTNAAPVNVLDFGGGDGWFIRDLYSRKIIHKDSKAVVYDVNSDILKCAEELCRPCKNISVASDLKEQVGKFDFVFLNMVDLCQPTDDDFADLFSDVRGCLAPGGKVVLTTQNPWARPGVFKYYKTSFARPDKYNNMSRYAVLNTKVEGVPGDLTDYHRPPQVTIHALNLKQLSLNAMATIDDNESLQKLIVPADKGRQWSPLLNSKGVFSYVRMDASGHILEAVDGSGNDAIPLDPKAGYLGMIATLKNFSFH